MEFNRLVSLVLGFVVLILLFVWISNRFRANTNTAGSGTTPTVTRTITPTTKPGTGWNPFGFLTRGTSTPTPSTTAGTVTPTKVIVKITAGVKPDTNTANNQTNEIGQGTKQITYKNYNTGQTVVVNEIPETGSPTIVLTLILAGLTGGIYLRKKI